MKKYKEDIKLAIEAIKNPNIYIKPPKNTFKLKPRRNPDSRIPISGKKYKTIYE